MEKTFKVGAAVGSGVVARAAEDGGADFLLAINAGRMRNMGLPSIACMLPIQDATSATLPFALKEVLPQAKVPVYIGISIWSAQSDRSAFIKQILDYGFTGIANFPSAMLFSPKLHHMLDRVGMGTQNEIDMLCQVEQAGGRGLFYCGTLEEARAGALAGLSALVFNFGWNVGGARTHRTDITLERAAFLARDVARVVRRINPKMEIFLEGGPILTSQDLTFVIRHADIDGYVGGSTIDRFPVQHSVCNQIAEYKTAAFINDDRSRQFEKTLERAKSFGLFGYSEAIIDFILALDRARYDKTPLEILIPPGCDSTGMLQFLIQNTLSQTAFSTYDFVADSSVYQVNATLFGRLWGDLPKQGLLESEYPYLILRDCQHMPKLIQKKLLSVMASGQFHRIGSREAVTLKPRLILLSKIGENPEWSDSTHTILTYPSLKSRHMDIRPLLERLLEQMIVQENLPNIRPAAYRILAAHDWHENERDLLKLAQIIAAGPPSMIYEAQDIAELLHQRQPDTHKISAKEAEREQILQVLVRNGFRKGATAKALGISRKTLYNRMKHWKLN